MFVAREKARIPKIYRLEIFFFLLHRNSRIQVIFRPYIVDHIRICKIEQFLDTTMEKKRVFFCLLIFCFCFADGRLDIDFEKFQKTEENKIFLINIDNYTIHT